MTVLFRRRCTFAPMPRGANELHGRVTSVVYIGTDTHFGITLPDGQAIRVREQNSAADSLCHPRPRREPVAVRFAAKPCGCADGVA